MSPVNVVMTGTAQAGCLACVAEVRASHWLKNPLGAGLGEPPCAYKLVVASRKNREKGSFLMLVY